MSKLMRALLVLVVGVVGGCEAGDAVTVACPSDGALNVSREIRVAADMATTDRYADQVALGLGPREVVLTFDDGPRRGRTRRVLDALAEECAAATFLLWGERADRAPGLVRELRARGHTVGTHTNTHPDLSTMTLEDAVSDIERGEAAVAAALDAPGEPLLLFRFPFFRASPEIHAWTVEQGRIALGAEVDSRDWTGAPCAEVVENVMRGLAEHDGGVVLLHDPERETACATERILDRMKAEGYRLVHLRADSTG